MIGAASFPTFHYRGRVVRVIDGDTVVFEADVGFRIYHAVEVRLIGVNAPELREVGGPEARDALMRIIGNGMVFAETDRDRRSFARYVARIYVERDGTLIDAGAELVRLGFATAT